jgi:hypothetical protein
VEVNLNREWWWIRREMVAEAGSLKTAMVAVVVEVKVGVTRCHFLWPPIVIFVRRFGRAIYAGNQPTFKVSFDFFFFFWLLPAELSMPAFLFSYEK